MTAVPVPFPASVIGIEGSTFSGTSIVTLGTPGAATATVTGGVDTVAATLSPNSHLGSVLVVVGPTSNNDSSTTIGVSAGSSGVTSSHTTRKGTNCLPSNASSGGPGEGSSVFSKKVGIVEEVIVINVIEATDASELVNIAATAFGHGTVAV